MKPTAAAAPPGAPAWRPYAVVAAIGLALYFQALFFGLTYLDDQVLISDNLHFLKRWSSLLESFGQGVFHVSHEGDTYYRPLFTASLVFDANLWGSWFGGYHLTSILVHLAASCLLLNFLRRLGHAERPALFFALAFAVSPALTQNVVHVPTRDDTLMGMFVLASMSAFISFIREGGWRSAGLHLVCWTLALFSKETAVVVVPMCLAYLALVEKGERPWPRAACLACGWLVVLAAWFLLRRSALDDPIPIGPGAALSSLRANLPGVVQLLGKVFLPFNLSGLPNMKDTAMGWGWAGLAAVLAAVLTTRGLAWKRVLFGLLWFAAFLAPSMLLQSTSMAGVVAEKRLYAPVVGIFLILLETNFARGIASGAGWAPTVGALALLVHGTVAFSYSRSYRDRMSFWTRTASASPRLPLARRNLGAMYFLDGDLVRAEREFLAALALNPVEPMVRNNLGLIYMQRGRLEEAEEQFLLELEYYPRYANALFNLGLLYMNQGKVKEPEELWAKALSINPDHLDLHVALAALYYNHGRKNEALAVINEMRRKNMEIPEAFRGLK
ncbi:MAG: tetratricopeptide repeat protein [Elusimicrobia bacterium]|nr:tetratricopeptide repeat protein [Elusimicrobiota bacterium]